MLTDEERITLKNFREKNFRPPPKSNFKFYIAFISVQFFHFNIQLFLQVQSTPGLFFQFPTTIQYALNLVQTATVRRIPVEYQLPFRRKGAGP